MSGPGPSDRGIDTRIMSSCSTPGGAVPMDRKDVKGLKADEDHRGDDTPATRCTIRDGVAVVECALEGSFIAYRDALGHLQRSGGYRLGMPMLMDLTQSVARTADAAVTHRVTALARFSKPPVVLRIAVLTSAARTSAISRTAGRMSRLGIRLVVFTSSSRARAWLLT